MNGEKGDKHTNQLNKEPYNADDQCRKFSSIEFFLHCTHSPCIHNFYEPSPPSPPV